MISIEEFREILSDELDLIPQEFFEELSGGIRVEPYARMHPSSGHVPLYIMGTYNVDNTGKYIILYYGSFERTMPLADSETAAAKIREVIRHEFRHHMEHLAGMYGADSLEREDRIQMRRYLRGE